MLGRERSVPRQFEANAKGARFLTVQTALEEILSSARLPPLRGGNQRGFTLFNARDLGLGMRPWPDAHLRFGVQISSFLRRSPNGTCR